MKKGTTIRMMATGAEEEVVEVGYFGAGQFIPCDELSAGMVGYITASIKNVHRHPGGRYHYRPGQSLRRAAAGLQEGICLWCTAVCIRRTGPSTRICRDALEKLQLNDASLQFEPETSIALGFGFRCGFLGLLHLEIIQERLEREYNLDLVTTAPGVIYKVS